MMLVGMLWYSNKPAVQAINEAVAYYQDKYGGTVNLCYVHPTAGECQVEGVEVRVAQGNLLPNHYWLGIRPEKDGE